MLLGLSAGGCGDAAPVELTRDTRVGDATCLSCHSDMAGFDSTAHAGTSALASAATIHGSFAEGENEVRTSNPYLHYRMEEREAGFYQVAVQGQGDDVTEISERMDVVVGSGRKGQTYLYWRGDRLYQLPVSYWTGVGWANSPGYVDGIANFDRPVPPRCLECHATYAASADSAGQTNQYDTTSLVTGVTCESCHGPGRAHVETRSSGGGWLRPDPIVDPGELPRERQVDGCALCHGGIGESLQPPFSYRPGEALSAYLHQPAPPPGAQVDVHGNQVALLARSACFAATEMTCATCHDVHRPQRELSEFSAVCTSCHTRGESLPSDHGEAMPGNCIDCHMPNLQTDVIVGDRAGGVLRPRVRSHWIRVYEGS